MRARTARAARALTGVIAAGTTLLGVLTAPSAGARSLDGCRIAQHRVHRGDADTARCAQLPPSHKGAAFTIQKETRNGKAVYVKYVLGRFTTNRRGGAVVDLTIRRKLYFGVHQVYFRVGVKETRDWIRVVRG